MKLVSFILSIVQSENACSKKETVFFSEGDWSVMVMSYQLIRSKLKSYRFN